MSDEPGLSATVRRSGAATAGSGGIANTGVMYLTNQPVAQSVYLQQVQQIFPFQLIGRDAELAELKSFCTRTDGASYMWWQGPAWAGKSALMAWFVLHPPPGIRVVSFFITARFAGQSDRTAFLEIMLEQLAEVAVQPIPNVLTESNQQAWFNQLLHDAAAACEQNKQRLVLVVDGLDEDRGVTSSPNIYSIAALLPAVPPEGVRLIVAGRPDPPVPSDVPSWHPLRDKKIVRPLSISPHAQMVRDDAERELDNLLDDQGPGRKLLALVTVARGGLSRDDLVELSGEPTRTVDRTLRSVLGRTFNGYPSRWQVSASPLFVLAHEELQQSAVNNLSKDEFAGFLGRLHDWADQYRRQGWPVGTPEYLLRGYNRLLTVTGDIKRMTDMATDRARLDRMLDVSGGDDAALAEIAAATSLILAQSIPDLTSMTRLAVYHERIAARNQNIPANLPAVWAALGRYPRAEALARSVPDIKRNQALMEVVKALTVIGLYEEAESVARGINHTILRAQALAKAAKALAVAGLRDRAGQVVAETRNIADSIADPLFRARTLTMAATALVAAGLCDSAGQVGAQAVIIADSISDPFFKTEVLTKAASALAAAGLHDQACQVADQAQDAVRLISPRSSRLDQTLRAVAEAFSDIGLLDRAETTARSVTNPEQRAGALGGLVAALAAAGLHDRAAQLAGLAEAAACAVTSPEQRAGALGGLVAALAAAGLHDPAVRLANEAASIAESITHPSSGADALTKVAAASASAGIADLAVQLAGRAEILARSITDSSREHWACKFLAESLADAGLYDKAAAVARSIIEPLWRIEALTNVACTLGAVGVLNQAVQLADEAYAAVSSLPDSEGQAMALAFSGARPVALAQVAAAFAAVGQHDRAVQLAGDAHAALPLITLREVRLGALAQIVESLPAGLLRDPAVLVAAQAPTLTGSTEPASPDRQLESTTFDSQVRVLARMVVALAAAGLRDSADQIAAQAQTLVETVAVHAGWEAPEMLAVSLATASFYDRAEAVARRLLTSAEETSTLAQVAAAFAAAGQQDRAVELAREADAAADSLTTRVRAEVLAQVAAAFAAAGQQDRAVELARQAVAVACAIVKHIQRETALTEVGARLTAAGLFDQAETAGRSIAPPVQRAEALVRLAAALAISGNAVRARHLTASALAVGHWVIPLRLRLLPPEALSAVADIII